MTVTRPPVWKWGTETPLCRHTFSQPKRSKDSIWLSLVLLFLFSCPDFTPPHSKLSSFPHSLCHHQALPKAELCKLCKESVGTVGAPWATRSPETTHLCLHGKQPQQHVTRRASLSPARLHSQKHVLGLIWSMAVIFNPFQHMTHIN